MPSYVDVVPQALANAAHEIAEISDDIAAASTAAMFHITHIPVAAEDEVSAAIALLFSEEAIRRQEALGRANGWLQASMPGNLRSASAAYEAAETFAIAELHFVEDNAAAFAKSPVGYLEKAGREVMHRVADTI